MDFGENDRLDNKRSFAAFALRLAIEALDRITEGEKKASASKRRRPTRAKDSGDEISHDLDPASEEWEGVIAWGSAKRTVAQSLKNVDLASLTDWDE
jgi:hypothetical protein